MPELPEVETVRRTLEPIIQGQRIESITIHYPGIIKEPTDTEAFKHRITNQQFQKIDRLGKFLLFYLEDDVMISHLRMEGRYGIYEAGEPVDAHTHVIFSLDNGKELRYRDVRKFGTMHVKAIGEEHDSKPINQLGVEPFDKSFTTEHLFKRLQKTTRMIKPALLDQSIVTGLGNIYVDEALFWSHIHPERRANTITEEEAVELQRFIVKVLQDAVDQGGSSVRSYVNSLGEVGMFQLQLAVYAKETEPCKMCETIIEKIKVGGRGTHFCPNCQPIIE
ncbi:DNA-formamidopyrimidine glycosylase [Halalkalibacillus sediminis]|uniref:Formamidopyrimidine-DNA glycosylase n=1 Tax=Halalkalibacillus sediminis TaxID=2018042 RepID=A0A2I0QY72_9BACI|nr:DNA-formamidopyrimidine glycosylase [Halalkalibacillus sediminis]PKR79258.1 DNA-formamidopyrimidine glycosylase [Halalkalibacillus sediminis]